MFAYLDTQVVAQRDFLGSLIGTEDIRLVGAAMLMLPVIVGGLGVGVYTSNQWLNAFLHARSVRLLSNEIDLLRNEVRLLRNEVRLREDEVHLLRNE